MIDEKKRRHREAQKRWIAANPDKWKEIVLRSRNKHRERRNAEDREKYWENPEKARARSLNWIKRNPERARASARAWNDKNREKINARARARRLLDIEASRAKERKDAGLPIPNRLAPELCEACGQQPSGRFKTLVLDHCHATGAFRGWLCTSCNIGLGRIGDTLEAVEKLRTYLLRNTAGAKNRG